MDLKESVEELREYLSTSSGRELVLRKAVGDRGIKQLEFYRGKANGYFSDLPNAYTNGLHKLIKQDREPQRTLAVFEESYRDFPELALDDKKINSVKQKLLNIEELRVRVNTLLASDFISNTGFIFLALCEGALQHNGISVTEEAKRNLLYGHMIAIDLSEGMDRAIDQDEYLEFLDDYRLMNPYILKLGQEMISVVDQSVYQSFESGFKRALKAQSLDRIAKEHPKSVTHEKMNRIYDKYRAVIGTAGRNMAFNRGNIAEIYDFGMAKAAEAGGCTDELMDSLKEDSFENPSWPFFFAIQTGSPRKAFELTLEKGRCYLDEARIALEMLPRDFPVRPFIGSLFLVLDHKMEHAFNTTMKEISFSSLEEQLQKI
jgi:hypothetical protein